MSASNLEALYVIKLGIGQNNQKYTSPIIKLIEKSDKVRDKVDSGTTKCLFVPRFM